MLSIHQTVDSLDKENEFYFLFYCSSLAVKQFRFIFLQTQESLPLQDAYC